MSAELQPDKSQIDLPLEIAHLLLIDIVGYSKLLINEQVELVRELNRVVRHTACFQAAEKEGKFVRVPTGDGMALLFFRSAEEPVRCALEISRALQDHPQIQVRMGIHSGPVNQIRDVNDQVNVAGSGINIGQRVLDCGDAGHILLSKHIVDDLGEYRHWQPYLHDLGECEVKHGLRLHIVNLYKDGLGNPALPEKLQTGTRWKRASHAAVRLIRTPGWPKLALMTALSLSAVAVALIFVISLRRATPASSRATVSSPIPEKSIAVLPFENLSADKENAFFTDGVQDEILMDLAKVADLKVISRTSVMQYKSGENRNLREIAKALGVAHVVEGTVQRAGDRVRVSAQLIDARTDTHLWGERYDRNLADVFAIESELAEKIVAQLKSKLSPEEKVAIKEQPTADLAAYDLYARAKDLIIKAVFNFPKGENLVEAARLLDQAVVRDPGFFLAYFQLAHAHDLIYFIGGDHTTERLALADTAIQSLRRLRPDAAETHLALARHLYWGYLNYDQARRELTSAQRLLPNDPNPLLLTAYIDRRQGRWNESVGNMKDALELDPRNYFILQQLALTYDNLRRYAEMAATLDRALELAPKNVSCRAARALVDLEWHADPRPLHLAIEAIVAEDPEAAPLIADVWMFLAFCERDPEAAARAVSVMTADGCRQESIPFPHVWCEGVVARLRGDVSAAQAAFLAARAEIEKNFGNRPENGPALCALGMVDAALGRKRAAVSEGRRATELLPVTKNSIEGALLIQYLAVIYASNGKKDLALEQLGVAAKLPGYLGYGYLRLHPYWDPLRGDPRFEKIVASLAPKQ